MNPYFLCQILFTHTLGTHITDVAKKAKEMNYKMFCHNWSVYSTNEYLTLLNTTEELNIKPIFSISSLVNTKAI